MTTSERRNTPSSAARPERGRLLGLALLIGLAGIALGAVGGAPRLPAGLPRPTQVVDILSGSTLPLEPVALLLLDLAWLLWAWVGLSLGLQLVVVVAELGAHGAVWVAALRGFADRLTLPLVRRAVAAAFAVQVLSRGVPMAAAQPVSSVDIALVANTDARAGFDPLVYAAATHPEQSSVATSTATYLVRPGDTLWSIADQAYGSGNAYRRLVEANLGRRMPNGEVFSARGVIQPGWELLVPEVSQWVEEVDGQRFYVVQAGDTLSGIAAAVLRDDSRWHELFELNRGALSPDGAHALADPNVIWPGLRLRLSPPLGAPSSFGAAERMQPEEPDLIVASASVSAPQVGPPETPDSGDASIGDGLPPLMRAVHQFEPIALEPSDLGDLPDVGVAAPAAGDSALPAPQPSDLFAPVALGGVGLATLAAAALGARRMRRLRPLPQEPESEVVVQGGFAEAQLTRDFTRGLHGVGFDPLAAVVGQVQRLLDEHDLGKVGVIAVRHGRSATTLTLAAGLAEQPLLVDLAPVFARRLEADADAWVSADQDVLLRLVRLRKTRPLIRLSPADGSTAEAPCLVPLGVLYDRQVYSAAWNHLGHVLVASLPGHGAETIMTSLVATLTARRSPDQLRVWMIAHPRALPAGVFDLPHLTCTVDPEDEVALDLMVDQLRSELDQRALRPPTNDLLVVVPELLALGERAAASFELLVSRGSSLGVHVVAATSCPQDALHSPLVSHFGTRMVLRMQDEETSVALLGVADAAFLGGGGRLLLRLDGREPVELYGYQVAPDHLERLVRVMRSAYAGAPSAVEQATSTPPPSSPQTESDPHAASEIETETADAPEAETEVSMPSPAEPDAQQVGPTAASSRVLAPIQVTCLGGPRVLCAGQQVWPRLTLGEAKPWELLLYLACQPPEGVASHAAVEALWPGDEEAADAPHRFRQLRYRLRRMLSAIPGAPETDGICLERGTLRLDPAIVYTDAQEFLALVRTARTLSGPQAIAHLERARELFIGDLLEGPDARRYAWVDERDESGVTLREHFRRLFQSASVKLAELYAASHEFEPAIDVYRELTEIDAGDERVWRALFRLHADRCDRPALVREERRMREALRELAAAVDEAGSPQVEEPSRDIVHEYQSLLAKLHEREPEPAAI